MTDGELQPPPRRIDSTLTGAAAPVVIDGLLPINAVIDAALPPPTAG